MQGGTDSALQSKIILNMISTWATGLRRSSLRSLKCKVYRTYAIALYKHHAISDRTLVSAGCPRAKLPQTPKDDCIDVLLFIHSFSQSVSQSSQSCMCAWRVCFCQRSLSSPFTVWLLGIYTRSSSLVASTFTH